MVSQFTLYGDTTAGRRPSWVAAAAPEVAEPLCDAFAAGVARLGVRVETGRFRADMRVALVNDGPVTLMLEAGGADMNTEKRPEIHDRKVALPRACASSRRTASGSSTPQRMRFRRVPRGTDPDSPSVSADWEPYFGLDVEADTGAFTVALNEDGTRRLRAVRAETPEPDDHTRELAPPTSPATIPV